MPRAYVTLAMLAALASACAQGCRTSVGATQSPTAATTLAQTPARHAPPFPALKRGADAFDSFINLGGGRRFESRKVGRKPARKDLRVEADYPVLLGDESPGAREFNRRARAFVVDEVTPYVESGPDPEKEKDPRWKGVEEYHDVSHKVVFASDEVVSVLFYIDSYNWGAAHGIHHPVTLNFDLKAGREIKLGQVFKPGSNYLRTVAAFCAEDLDRQFASKFPDGLGFFRDGLKPSAKNFRSWVVTRDGLVFIFEEYQVVAYADGEPKVLIPFGRLKEIMRHEGALSALADTE